MGLRSPLERTIRSSTRVPLKKIRLSNDPSLNNSSATKACHLVLRPKRRHSESLSSSYSPDSSNDFTNASSTCVPKSPSRKRQMRETNSKSDSTGSVLSGGTNHSLGSLKSRCSEQKMTCDIKLDEFTTELSSTILNGMSAEDYRDRMLATLRIYKAMGTSDEGRRPVFKPFLTRNLMFVKAYKYKSIPVYSFGENEPPAVWPYTSKSKCIKNRLQKKIYLNALINAIKDRGKIIDEISKKEGIVDYSFSISTLAAYRKKHRNALFADKGYRGYLISSGINIAIPTLGLTHQVTKTEPLPRFKSPSLDSPPSPIYSTSLVFSSLRHNLLGGDRIAKVQVYLVRQVGKRYAEAERLPSATFTIPVNTSLSRPISIDLPCLVEEGSPRKNLRVHMIIRVDIGKNKSEISVDGRSLRNTPGRSHRSPNDTLNSPPSERSSSRLKKKAVTEEDWEISMYGTRCLFCSPTEDGYGGYINGDGSVILIEEDLLENFVHEKGILPELELLSKKLHSNPFVQLSVVSETIVEDGSDNSSTINAESSCENSSNGGADGDDEGSLSDSDEANSNTITLKTVIDAYSGLFKMGEDGKYVNDVRTIESMWDSPLSDMNSDTLGLLRTWLKLEIPPMIIYRISACDNISEMEADMEAGSDKWNSEKSTADSFTDCDQLAWITSIEVDCPQKCILCRRSFTNTFALLIHYHIQYPRLAVHLNFNVNTEVDPNWKGLHLDVFLDPHFDDTMEVGVLKKGSRQKVRPPVFLWTRDQAVELRSKMKMDLTLFCDFLMAPDHVADEQVAEHRFIHPHNGRWMKHGEELPMMARLLPAPGHKLLCDMARRRINDYVDMSAGSKWFMTLWNTMTFTLGKARSSEAGIYWLSRLFVELYHGVLTKNRQRHHLVYMWTILDDQYKLTITDTSDLICRLYANKSTYDPLKDSVHPMRRKLYSELSKGYEKFRLVMDNPNTDPGQRRAFPRLFRKDPSNLSNNELYQLLHEALDSEMIIPAGHRMRRYLLSTLDALFDGEMPECIEKLRLPDNLVVNLKD